MLGKRQGIIWAAAMLCAAGCNKPGHTGIQPGREKWRTAPGNERWRPVSDVEVANAPEAEPPKILPETHFAAARLFESQGLFDKAIDQYRRAIAVNHNYAEAHHRLGLVLSMTGKRDEALKVLRKAVKLRPDDAILRNNLGFELLLSRHLKEAERELSKAIARKPDLARAYVNLGIVQGRLQRFDEALASFRAVLPEADAYYNLGLLYRSQRLYEEAVGAMRQALSIDPDFRAARTRLAQLASPVGAAAPPEPDVHFASRPAEHQGVMRDVIPDPGSQAGSLDESPEDEDAAAWEEAFAFLDEVLAQPLEAASAKPAGQTVDKTSTTLATQRRPNRERIIGNAFPGEHPPAASLAEESLELAAWDEAFALLDELMEQPVEDECSQTRKDAVDTLPEIHATHWTRDAKPIEPTVTRKSPAEPDLPEDAATWDEIAAHLKEITAQPVEDIKARQVGEEVHTMGRRAWSADYEATAVAEQEAILEADEMVEPFTPVPPITVWERPTDTLDSPGAGQPIVATTFVEEEVTPSGPADGLSIPEIATEKDEPCEEDVLLVDAAAATADRGSTHPEDHEEIAMRTPHAPSRQNTLANTKIDEDFRVVQSLGARRVAGEAALVGAVRPIESFLLPAEPAPYTEIETGTSSVSYVEPAMCLAEVPVSAPEVSLVESMTIEADVAMTSSTDAWALLQELDEELAIIQNEIRCLERSEAELGGASVAVATAEPPRILARPEVWGDEGDRLTGPPAPSKARLVADVVEQTPRRERDAGGHAPTDAEDPPDSQGRVKPRKPMKPVDPTQRSMSWQTTFEEVDHLLAVVFNEINCWEALESEEAKTAGVSDSPEVGIPGAWHVDADLPSQPTHEGLGDTALGQAIITEKGGTRPMPSIEGSDKLRGPLGYPIPPLPD